MTESRSELETARNALEEAGIQTSCSTHPGGRPFTLPFLRFGLPEAFQILEVPRASAGRAIEILSGLGIDRRAGPRKNVRAFALTLVTIVLLAGIGFFVLELLGR